MIATIRIGSTIYSNLCICGLYSGGSTVRRWEISHLPIHVFMQYTHIHTILTSMNSYLSPYTDVLMKLIEPYWDQPPSFSPVRRMEKLDRLIPPLTWWCLPTQRRVRLVLVAEPRRGYRYVFPIERTIDAANVNFADPDSACTPLVLSPMCCPLKCKPSIVISTPPGKVVSGPSIRTHAYTAGNRRWQHVSNTPQHAPTSSTCQHPVSLPLGVAPPLWVDHCHPWNPEIHITPLCFLHRTHTEI